MAIPGFIMQKDVNDWLGDKPIYKVKITRRINDTYIPNATLKGGIGRREYLTAQNMAKWGVSPRQVQKLLAEGRLSCLFVGAVS